MTAMLGGCISSGDVLDPGPQPGVIVTGEYPSLGAPLESATEQMSAEEESAMAAELGSLANGGQATGMSEAQYRAKLLAMKKLADNTRDAAKPEN